MDTKEPPTPNSGPSPASQTTDHPLQLQNSQSAGRVASPSSLASPSGGESIVMTEDYIQQAQPDELRAIISSLMPLLQEARTDSAHHKLQYRMLAIETTEAMERIQVEMEMAQRETDLLKINNPVEPRIVRADQEPDPSIRHVHADIWDSMIKETQSLKSQNAQLEQLVSQHKRMVVQQESEIATLNDRITLYRERLRENRSHLNRCRRAAGYPESPYKSSPYNARERDQPPFATLLHASDLMSGRSPTTPRTPQTPPRRRRATSITPMPYQTPETLHSSRYLQVPQTAPPLRNPQLQPSNSERLASTKYQTTMLEQILVAEESEAETDVPNEDFGSIAGAPRTPARIQKKSTSRSVSSGVLQQRLFGQVRKAGNPQDATTKTSVPEQARQSRDTNV
jgi:myosin heavy subunit